MQEDIFKEFFEKGFADAKTEAISSEIEKQASNSPVLDEISKKFSEGVGSATANIILGKGLGSAISYTKGLFTDPHKKLSSRQMTFISHLIRTDPILKNRDPKKVISFYRTMVNLAPSVAFDPNVVSSFLRESTMYDTINTPTIKSLLDIEQNKAKIDKYRSDAEFLPLKLSN